MAGQSIAAQCNSKTVSFLPYAMPAVAQTPTSSCSLRGPGHTWSAWTPKKIAGLHSPVLPG
eukprot:scaffold582814_cov15-Prasinocladus_malaysianus.AAC.1